MLRALVEHPMLICLFSGGPEGGDDAASLKSFTPTANTEHKRLEFRDWRIDEELVEAAADKQIFRFKAPAGRVLGYYIMTRKDEAIICYERFTDPVPVNSSEDTVAVRPRVIVRAPSK